MSRRSKCADWERYKTKDEAITAAALRSGRKAFSPIR